MNKKQLFSFLIIALGLFIISSCIKKKFDDPPEGWSYDPQLTVTHSIWQLKQMYYANGTGVITQDMTIAGVVVADDRSGNFYKQIIIQDTSSGITVLLGRSSGLYNDFPIGRKIYIKCKGLYLGAYGGFIQLGGGFDVLGNSLYEIPNNSIDKFVVKANYPNPITPLKVKINQIAFSNASQTELQRKWLGTLITIDSVEFVPAEVGQPYAQNADISSGTDRNIQDCPGSKIVIRNSGYSQFRMLSIPAGNGPLTAIYSTYESSTKKTPQLLLRDTSDVKLYNIRCNGVVITPPVDITIDSLRRLYIGSDTGQTIILPNLMIHGVVTCSIQDSSISKYSLMLQDESNRAIVVYYPSGYTYKMGDSITVDVSAQELIYYRGTLEVKANTTKTTKISSDKTITPIVLTLSEINADLNLPVFSARKYESVVVKVMNCTITGTPATFSGDKTISDGTATMVLYTRFSSSFAADPYPTTPVSITGHAIKFYAKNEISMRNSFDVQ